MSRPHLCVSETSFPTLLAYVNFPGAREGSEPIPSRPLLLLGILASATRIDIRPDLAIFSRPSSPLCVHTRET